MSTRAFKILDVDFSQYYYLAGRYEGDDRNWPTHWEWSHTLQAERWESFQAIVYVRDSGAAFDFIEKIIKNIVPKSDAVFVRGGLASRANLKEISDDN